MATPAVAEIIDPVFVKTSQNARFLLSENERFGLIDKDTKAKCCYLKTLTCKERKKHTQQYTIQIIITLKKSLY